MNIGFWNLNRKDVSDIIVQMIIENGLDIICLAEVKSDDIIIDIIKKYKKIEKKNLFHIHNSKDKVIVLSRLQPNLFQDVSFLYQSKRLISFKLELKNKIILNLVFIHFHSKNNWSDISLAMECTTIASAIKNIEIDTKSENTILIGDFNMNPFESGLISTTGLNTISDKSFLDNKKHRVVDETNYNFFYNPMWNFFGDKNEVKGTYYYRSPGNISYEWNIFDQILIRPSLIKHLDDDSIKIISRISTQNLLTEYSNRPDTKISDHLPIAINLKF
ncbi:endonuclease/exonuclease/phosphatase family protein [Myroides odoratus]|uniref:endonuclease/exonuclease/phosphatase family protein n=1 Tax=Myroides odoratus TaxID=256 RepID=UPI00333EC91A